MQNFRLDNGKKIWKALWEFQSQDAECFTAQVSQSPIICTAHIRPVFTHSTVVLQSQIRKYRTLQATERLISLKILDKVRQFHRCILGYIIIIELSFNA